jgi:hypothetical protein
MTRFPVEFGNGLDSASQYAEEFRPVGPAKGAQLAVEMPFTDEVVVHHSDAVGIGMPEEAADKSLDKVESNVAEKAQPKFEVANAKLGGIDAVISFVPEAAAPEGALLSDVAIGAGNEAVAGPTGSI